MYAYATISETFFIEWGLKEVMIHRPPTPIPQTEAQHHHQIPSSGKETINSTRSPISYLPSLAHSSLYPTKAQQVVRRCPSLSRRTIATRTAGLNAVLIEDIRRIGQGMEST